MNPVTPCLYIGSEWFDFSENGVRMLKQYFLLIPVRIQLGVDHRRSALGAINIFLVYYKILKGIVHSKITI